MGIKVERTTTENKDFRFLEKKLDDELNLIYGEIQKYNFSQYNHVNNLRTVIIYDVRIPIACGCLKFLNKDLAEVKRVYVSKDSRCKGLSKIIMKELEKWASENNIKALILQTGVEQQAAINLYIKMGYTKMENYEPYVNDIHSVCMKRYLQPALA